MPTIKNETMQDYRYVAIKDIVAKEIEMMQILNTKNDNLNISIKDVSQNSINDLMKALDLLAFDNGRKVTRKDGVEISLNRFIKDLIDENGESEACDKIEKLLTSERISQEAKEDLRTYLKIDNMANYNISMISIEIQKELKEVVESYAYKSIEEYERDDDIYKQKLKNVSEIGRLGNDLCNHFSDNFHNLLRKHLLTPLYIATIKEKENLHSKELNTQNLANKSKLTADDRLLEDITNSYLNFESKSITLDVKDLVYQSLNKSDFGTDFEINQESRGKFITGLKNDADKSGFNITKPPKTIQAGWATYQSWNLTGGEKFKSQDIAHRFYVSIRPDKMYDVANVLYLKYKEKNIPFYFKVNDSTQNNKIMSRKDNIVIYTTNEYLQENLEIINKLNEDCKEMKFCEENSKIIGKIANGIGYASETANAEHSYTERVSIAFSKAFENVVDKNKLENLTYDKYKSVLKTEINNIKEKNPKILYDSIRQQLKNDGFDIENICCDADVFKNLLNFKKFEKPENHI